STRSLVSRSLPLVGGRNGIVERDRAAAEDVSAQPCTVHEWAQQAGPRHPLEVCAWLCQTATDALDRADREAAADQGVEVDATCGDVAARLLPGQLQLVQHLGLHQRQLITAAGPAEGAAAVVIAVALQAAA